jgi:hypothetical protein
LWIKTIELAGGLNKAGDMHTDKPQITVLPRWIITLFLWIGLSAAISIRLLAFLNRVDPVLASWVWRFAMLAYTFFFGYRYWIARRRRHVVERHALIQQVEACTCFDGAEKLALLYILKSIMRSKELFNYAFICLLSIIALTLDLLAR